MRGLVGCVMGFALLGYALVGAVTVQAPRTLERLTEPERPKAIVLTSDTAEGRAAFIKACESRGGAAVVRAGVLSSRGIVCVPQLGD